MLLLFPFLYHVPTLALFDKGFRIEYQHGYVYVPTLNTYIYVYNNTYKIIHLCLKENYSKKIYSNVKQFSTTAFWKTHQTETIVLYHIRQSTQQTRQN